MQDDILDANDVAQRLKVSYRHIVRLAEKGMLPSFRLGSLWKFRARDIDAYIDEQVRKSTHDG